MLATHKGEIPFVIYILPFLVGISLALSFSLSAYQTVLTIIFGILLVAFVGFNLFYQQVNLHRKLWVGGVIIHVLFLLAGLLTTVNYDDRNSVTYFARQPADVLLVKVSNEPQLKGNFLRFTAYAEVAACKGAKRYVSGTLLLILRTDSTHARTINYGDELLIPANYTPIDPPFNPAEFNYKLYMAHQNIYAQAFLNPADVVLLRTNAGNQLVAYSLKLRQHLVAQFKTAMHSPEAISVASTLILGYKAELDNDILQAYSKTGTIHVLSVSGAHVAIIFVLLGWLLGFMDRYRYGKVLKAVVTIVLIWYYSLLTGLSPAVCRAAVMISLIIIGKTYNRRISTLNILAASAFTILIVDPFLIADVGFQLSYLAVAGLIVFQPIVYGWLDVDNKWLDKLWLYCAASIAAQAITFPLSAYYFHQFPVYFLVSNLFILIPVEVIMFAGIACLALAQMGALALANVAGYVLEKSILLMDWGLKIMEQSPYASAGKIWINRAEYLLLFAIVILLFCLAYYKRPVLLKLTLVCTLILSVGLSLKRIRGIRTNTITFFNLKKQPAILFKQGSRAVLLTDMGDTDKAYRYSIQPCLDSNRIIHLTKLAFNRDTVTAYWAKRGPLVRFMDKQVVILDVHTFTGIPAPKFRADYLFINGGVAANASMIDKGYNYNLLISSAGNPDNLGLALKNISVNDNKKIYMLKRNKSLVIKSD
jgi:competence protein ComEC